MSLIGDISGSVGRAANAGRTVPEPVQLEVFKREGEVLVQNTNSSSAHLLADQHCYDCTTAFGALQSKAESGEDKGGLFELAVKQTDRAQRVLGTVAKPGPGPLDGLTPQGAIRATEPLSVDPRGGQADGPKDSVTLSRTAVARSTGIEVASTSTAAGVLVEPKGAAERAVTEPDDANTRTQDSVLSARPVGEVSETLEGKPEGDESGTEEKKDSLKAKISTAKRELSESEQQQVSDLQQRDTEVRAHEQAHKSAAGGHGGAISLSYQTGPDGRKYAVGGSVPVDISPIKGDASATIQKMQVIQRAALAPAEPSSADRRVAARASQFATKARMELQAEQRAVQEAPKKPGGKTAEAGAEAERKAADGPKAPDAKKADAPNPSDTKEPTGSEGIPRRPRSDSPGGVPIETQGDRSTITPGGSSDGVVGISRSSRADGPSINGGSPRGVEATGGLSRQAPLTKAQGQSDSQSTFSANERNDEEQLVETATTRPTPQNGGTYGQTGQYGGGGGYARASLNIFA